MQSDDIRKLIAYACQKCGVPELAVRIRFRWSNRLTTTMGTAKYEFYAQGYGGLLTFSISVFGAATPEQKIKNVIHEACHIIAFYKHRTAGLSGYPAAHGRLWKNCMIACGLPPERCHNVAINRRGHQRYETTCDCRTHYVTGIRISKMLKGYKYSCKYCHKNLLLTPNGAQKYREYKAI